MTGSSAERYALKDFRGSSHRILTQWIRELAAPGGRVLELGPAAAHLYALVRRPDLTWRGIDADPRFLSGLRATGGGVIADLDSLPRLAAGFDLIVAADVLEHLSNPERMLRMIHAALSPGKALVASVPNVANIHVRMSLLCGRFDYRERGILDRTHRYFFTRRTLLGMLRAAGFSVERQAVSLIPLPFVMPWAGRWSTDLLLRLLSGVTRLAPTLLGYQLLVVARR